MEAAENKWVSVKDRLPEERIVVLCRGHGSDIIVQQEDGTLEDAIKRVQQIPWKDIGCYDSEEGGWLTFDGMPMIIAPEEWKAIDWS